MFVLNSDITIDKFTGVKPHQVSIKKSMYEYVDRATIKLPISARVKQAGKLATESVETNKLITEGMKVTIQLGYNGVLNKEFEGFVSRVNLTTPCEVMCEGYSYQLRKRTYLKTFKQAQLIDVLKYLIDGTDIVLDKDNIPSFEIEKLLLQNHSGTEALELIKKISDNTINIFFTGNLLYAGLQYLVTKSDVKYNIGYNVIKDGNLKLREAKNENVIVNYIGEKKDGTKVKVNGKTNAHVITSSAQSGNNGETKVVKTHAVIDEVSLQSMADKKQKQLSYDGYEGKITAFLLPYCEPGYRAIIDDKKYPDRGGNYLVDTTEIMYGMSGARRTVGIAFKL